MKTVCVCVCVLYRSKERNAILYMTHGRHGMVGEGREEKQQDITILPRGTHHDVHRIVEIFLDLSDLIRLCRVLVLHEGRI